MLFWLHQAWFVRPEARHSWITPSQYWNFTCCFGESDVISIEAPLSDFRVLEFLEFLEFLELCLKSLNLIIQESGAGCLYTLLFDAYAVLGNRFTRYC